MHVLSAMQQAALIDKEAHEESAEMKVVQKNTSYTRLALCFAGIFVSYFIYGLLQEKM